VGRAGTILSSALAVAVVGAVLSFAFGWAGQRIAREWQEEDKRLEVRTELVQGVSEASADFIGVVRLRGIGAVNDTALDTAYRKWAIASSSIRGDLHAYVESEEVQRRWRNYKTNMAHVYYLFRAPDKETRRFWLRRISGYWGPEDPKGAFLVLEGLLEPPSPGRPRPVYEASLRSLLDRLEQRSEVVAGLILEASTTI
jgi:hypothetical protein